MLKKNNILQILSLSYPILTHIAISQNEFKLALLMLGIIAGLFILNRSKQPEKTPNFFFDLALWIGLIIFAIYIIFVDAIYVALYLPPVLILSFFFCILEVTLENMNLEMYSQFLDLASLTSWIIENE